jgi:hypothetical protein
METEATGKVMCKWVKARSETDAAPWSTDGLLFRDVQRHNAFQRLLRWRGVGEPVTDGELYNRAKNKLPKNDLMMAYVEQLRKNMEIPIYMARDRLCFFNGGNFQAPAIASAVDGPTTSLPTKPNSAADPTQSIAVNFRDEASIQPNQIHAADAISNEPNSPPPTSVLDIIDSAPAGPLISYMETAGNLKPNASVGDMARGTYSIVGRMEKPDAITRVDNAIDFTIGTARSNAFHAFRSLALSQDFSAQGNIVSFRFSDGSGNTHTYDVAKNDNGAIWVKSTITWKIDNQLKDLNGGSRDKFSTVKDLEIYVYCNGK